MKIVIKQKDKVTKLVTVFRHLKSLTEMVNIILTDKKFYIQGLDSNHVCLIELVILSEWFDNYESENLTLGVSCNILFKIIDCWKDGQVIRLYSTPGEDKLYIDFEGEGTFTKNFALPLINIESELLDIPEAAYQVDLALKSDIFKELVCELAVFNDTIRFNYCDEDIAITAEGDAGRMKVVIGEGDIEEFSIEEDCALNINVSANYIAQICDFYKLNSCVYIHCGSEMPIKVHYSLDDLDSAESTSYMRFFVAPKIDD